MMVAIEKGRQFIREGEFEKAQIILRRALKENPEQPEVMELSGDLSARVGRVDEAIVRYEQAVDVYKQQNLLADAIICLEKIIRLKPTNSGPFFQLADTYRDYGLLNEGINRILKFCVWTLENRDEEQFIEGLKKILELQPDNYRLRLAFVKILFSLNRNQEAEKELQSLKSMAVESGQDDIVEEINKLLPQTDGGEELDPKSRVELGNLLYEIGSKEEAITEFKQAVEDLIAAGETDEAEKILERIIEIDPDNQEAINKLNELKPGVKKIEKAVEEKEGAEVSETEVEKEPSVNESASLEAEVRPAEPASEESEEEEGESFEDVKKEVEDFIPADKAAQEFVLEEKEEEREETSRVEAQTADINPPLQEAEVPAASGFELAGVFNDFRSDIAWTADDPGKRLELAKKAFDAEIFDLALKFAEKIRDDKSTWPTSIEITCASLVKLGQYNEVIKIADSSVFEDIPGDKSIELRYILAMAYEGIGDFENAMREIEHIMKINPDYKDIKEHYRLMGGEIEVEVSFEEKVEEEKAVAEVEPVSQIPEHKLGPDIPPPSEPSPESREESPFESFPEQGYPSIIEGEPEKKKPPELISDRPPEEKEGENITFL